MPQARNNRRQPNVQHHVMQNNIQATLNDTTPSPPEHSLGPVGAVATSFKTQRFQKLGSPRLTASPSTCPLAALPQPWQQASKQSSPSPSFVYPLYSPPPSNLYESILLHQPRSHQLGPSHRFPACHSLIRPLAQLPTSPCRRHLRDRSPPELDLRPMFEPR